jgi:hypothetical protein
MTSDERELAELEASARELVGAIARQIDFYVEQMGLSKSEASQRARDLGLANPTAKPVDQVSWNDLTNLLEKDPTAGQALWKRVKESARQELATGTRTGRSLEARIGGGPYERAQIMVVIEGLRQSLQPRDAVEEMLIHQLAAAFELQLRWQTLAVHRMEEETWQAERDRRRTWENLSERERDRYERDHGWLPPRQTDAAAIEQAVMMADRHQRSFLRLLKAFRDTRRLVGTVVLAGGQLNIAEQQVNVAASDQTAKPRPARRVEKAKSRMS